MTGLDKDVWGDNELTARDLSSSYMASMADWTAYFAEKGYTMPYPTLLYAIESAEKIYDDLMDVLTKWHEHKDTRIDLYTRFQGDLTEGVHAQRGLLLMAVLGMHHLNPLFKPEVEFVLRTAAQKWVATAYDDDTITTQLQWVPIEEADSWEHSQLAPLMAGYDTAPTFYFAKLTPCVLP